MAAVLKRLVSREGETEEEEEEEEGRPDQARSGESEEARRQDRRGRGGTETTFGGETLRFEEAVRTGWRRERRRGLRRGREGEREKTAELCIVGDLSEMFGEGVSSLETPSEWKGWVGGGCYQNTLHEQLLQKGGELL